MAQTGGNDNYNSKEEYYVATANKPAKKEKLPNLIPNANRTNVCSPVTSVLITEGTSMGISRSTLNNSGIPSFCMDAGTPAPDPGDIFYTTNDPDTDLDFDSNNYTKAQSRDAIRRIMSVLTHPDYAPNTLPTSLTSNFYKAIAYNIWKYSDDRAVSSSSSWTGADGNTYTAYDLENWVTNGTLQPANVLWMIPQGNNLQPEVMLNPNTSSDCCPVDPTITTTVTPATSGNNGQISIDSASNALFYGVSSLNAGSYDGPTTIVTATVMPNSLPSNILSNLAAGTYIVRVFNTYDECFTDITLSTAPNNNNCGNSKVHVGSCWSTEVVSVTPNNGKFDIQILVTYIGSGGGPNGCKALSHYSIEADNNSFSNVSWAPASGNPSGNISLSLGNNDPFDGFKLDNVSGIGDSNQGSFTMNYTLDYLQDQQFLAKAGNDYTQIASFTVADFQQVQACSAPQCDTADNQTATASITEGQTKTLVGSPSGGTWSIVSGGGSINGTTYTPDDINADTNITIRYTIAATGSCSASTDDVTFTVTPVCVTAVNSTATASITEGDTKTLVGSPSGGTWSIVSGGGSINGTTYTPADINTNTDVTIRYTIAADGSCAESTADVTFTVTPVCVTAVNSTATASITEGDTKTLVGSPSGGTWSIVGGGGSINGTTYTPADISSNTDVTIRYTIAADGSCAESTDDVTFTVTPDANCSIEKTHVGGCWTTEVVSVTPNNGDFDIQVLVTFTGLGGCKELSHFSVEATPGSYSNVSWAPVSGNPQGNIALSLGNNDPFDGFKVDNMSGIGDGNAGSFTINYTLDNLQNQQFLAKAGNDYTQIASFTLTDFNQVLNCGNNTNCVVADNQTASASITEGDTKTLVGSPSGGTWSIVSGGGSINGTTFTPADINTNTDVTIRYTIAATGSCSETYDDVTFTVTPDCVTAVNSTATASITEGDTKTLVGSPSGGTWSIVSGGGSINGTTYTPADISVDTDVTIRYTIAADGSCAETFADVTFTVTPVTILGSIGDRVWFDTDKDTNQDSGEPGLEGATVTLDPGTPGDPSDDQTMVTDANGNYLFDNLPAGDYIITVDVSTVTGGIPSGKTPADLVQNFDYDGLGTPSKSFYSLGAGEQNLEQDFGFVVPTGNTGCGGNCGGIESESLGDAVTKVYINRKKNSIPTEFVKNDENKYDKKKLQKMQPKSKGQTMLDMFPTELVSGDVAHVTSPTDILDYTIADEVLSVDFSLNGQTKGVVLGIKTSDRVYNHTKAS
ncbi:MAG: hypothetical protein CMB99_02195, partial [Flavobacteriaceae bacterium]|nr:hypothetical protein [Flavobacteriaceae bacterium]